MCGRWEDLVQRDKVGKNDNKGTEVGKVVTGEVR